MSKKHTKTKRVKKAKKAMNNPTPPENINMTEQEIQTEWVSYAKLQVEREEIVQHITHFKQQAIPFKQQFIKVTAQMQDIHKRIIAAESGIKQTDIKKPNTNKK